MSLYHTKHYTHNISSAILLTFFLILTGGVVSSGYFHMFITFVDEAVRQYVTLHATTSCVNIMTGITHLADGYTIIFLQSIVFFILLFIHRDRLGALMIFALLSGEGILLVVKELIARPRPNLVGIFDTYHTFSYPSGHTLIATIFYGFLGYLIARVARTKKIKVVILSVTSLVIFLIGISRVVIGAHWLSDVIGGWLLGGAVLSGLITTLNAGHIWKHEGTRFPHGYFIALGLVLIVLSFILLGYMTWAVTPDSLFRIY